MPHRDLLPERIKMGVSFQVRFQAQDREYSFVELKPAFFDKVHHGCGREGLAHAGDAKQ
jgi:hypothetical protein